MYKSKKFWFILLGLFVLLFGGLGGIYFLVMGIYSADTVTTNLDAQKMLEWEMTDSYLSPEDGMLNQNQLNRFLNVNRELSSFVFKVRQQLEENSWQIAFDIIRMRPEWIAIKYKALEKCKLSPKEYDWIVDRVIDFWVYRWKEQSIERLNEYGWEFDEIGSDSTKKPINYDLLLIHEEELNLIFDILWPEKPTRTTSPQDSSIVSAQEED